MEVKVYRNLHKSRWSVVALEGNHKGRVIAHADEVQLVNATFRVSESGRQRCLAEQRRNVHAYVVGCLWAWGGVTMRYEDDIECLGEKVSIFPGMDKSIHYNPYRGSTFKEVGSGKKIHQTPAIALKSSREVVCK